jgi:hypothetical protein
VCTEGHRDALREYRVAKRGLAPAPPVNEVFAPGPCVTVEAAGPCESATRSELESLQASGSRLAMAAAALCMARLMDDRRLATTVARHSNDYDSVTFGEDEQPVVGVHMLTRWCSR